jgi:hypothetical protein
LKRNVYFLLSIVFLLSSCHANSSHSVKTKIGVSDLSKVPIKKVAIFPVQNATGRNLVLYSGRGNLVDRTVTALLDKEHMPASQDSFANPLYVQRELAKGAYRALYKKGYEIVSPALVEREYARISTEKTAVSPFELSLSIPADAFLMITVTDWDSEDFTVRGRALVGFKLAIIRAKNGDMLWQKEIPRRYFELSNGGSSTIVPYKRQEELLDDISFRITKDLPKPEEL